MSVLRMTPLLLALAAFTPEAAQKPVRRDLLVAAAASLSVVERPLTVALHDATGIDVRFNFAGSNALARQIVEGARVDAFISADEAQMDAVERAGRMVAGSRVDIVSNQLVIVRSGPPGTPSLDPAGLSAAAVRRVAMGDPAAVPAGVYGRQWLERIRLWSAVAPKVVPMPSSPAAVAAVVEGRADAAIVYASDVAAHRTGILIAHRVAPEDAPAIVYPAAAIAGGRVQIAREFIAFLRSARAQEIFAAAGFRPLHSR